MSHTILFCPDELSDQEEAGFPSHFALQVARITQLARQEELQKLERRNHLLLIESRIADSVRSEFEEALDRNPALKAAYSAEAVR